ncbi:uncharacterized protein LOC141628593 [Silene latifolia]|uniref:uncharacterized protein LOC141628593 n=1 Tax=Silene latifolia TaxID=37657 RepID=UPI003D7765F6
MRGLNSPAKQEIIKWFLHQYQVGLFGLLETKVKPMSLNSVRNNICANCAHFIHMKAKEVCTGDEFYITMMYSFNELNRAQFDDIENNTVRAWQYLVYIQGKLRCDPLNYNLIQQEIDAAKSYRKLNNSCYNFLQHKSKVTWVDKGDNNTKYFHSVLKSRQIRNKVVKIADQNGVICDSTSQIQEAFLSFYKNMLGTAKVTTPVCASVVQQGIVCSPTHAALLLAPVTNAEIKKIMFSIPIHKSAGPDGFSSAFFRDC